MFNSINAVKAEHEPINPLQAALRESEAEIEANKSERIKKRLFDEWKL